MLRALLIWARGAGMEAVALAGATLEEHLPLAAAVVAAAWRRAVCLAACALSREVLFGVDAAAETG